MDLRDVAGRIASSGRVVALTGAGVSAESGIPTYRDAGGIWEQLDPDDVGTTAGFLRFLVEKPWQAIEFLKGLRDTLERARPNPGHEALADLERCGSLRCVITQNVDGLHWEAGNTRVIELHGTFARRRCLACGIREAVTRADFVEELGQMIAKLGSYMVSHPAHILRRCECGGLFRSDFVAFGEPVQGLDEAVAESRGAEVMLVCGTSGVVYPAAGLPEEARAAGAFVVEVNPNETDLSRVAQATLRGPSGEVLPQLVALVRQRRRDDADVPQSRVAG